MPTSGVVAVICCIDPKVQPGVFRWAAKRFGEGNFSLIAARGATLPFFRKWRWFRSEYRHVMNELRFIAHELGLNSVHVVAHSGCAAWTACGYGPAKIIPEETFHRGKGQAAINKLGRVFSKPADLHYSDKEKQDMRY